MIEGWWSRLGNGKNRKEAQGKARKSSLGFGQGHWGALEGFGKERGLMITTDSLLVSA